MVTPVRPVVVLSLALFLGPVVPCLAQTLAVDTVGEAVKIRASGFSVLQGDPLARLKDGRTVRIEFTAMVLPGPGKSAVATARCMLTPLMVMIRMAGVPPPMPRSEEKAPRLEPRAARIGPFGMFSSCFVLRPRMRKMNCRPSGIRKRPKAILSCEPSMKLVRMTPAITPPTTQGSHPLRMFQSTAPLFACA